MNDKTQQPGAPQAAPDPRRALDAAIDAARLADPLLRGADGREHAFVPEGHQLVDITDPHRLPPRIMDRVVVDERQSLTDYCNRFRSPGSILIADFDRLAITAFLDWHMPGDEADPLLPEAVGACRHQAALIMRPSEEFARWDEFEGDLHRQDEFAAFLEENAVDVVHPESAVLLEIARDLEATQGVAFKSSTRLESGDRAFQYENETHVKGDVKVPREFSLNIPLYQGEEPVELRAALRFRVGGQGLFLGFEWRRVQYQRLAYFRQIATQIVEDTGLPVFYGRRG